MDKTMSLEVRKQNMIAAVDQVIARDSYLLLHDLYEPAISHRLAFYLSHLFEEFDVDCEYNGNIDAPNGRKILRILSDRARELGLWRGSEENQEFVHRGVYPDIIVHKRGRNGPDNNILVIEVKKSSSQISYDWDREKLMRFTSSRFDNLFVYSLGVLIKMSVIDEIGYSMEWYKDGARIE